MTNANEPILTDLKKLLRRLEKIDPEAPKKARSPAFEPTTNALNLQKAVHEEAKTGHTARDGLIDEQPRITGLPTDPCQSAELPVIVKPSRPVANATERESGALRVVVIATVTAAIVSALATGFTVYWLNGGAGNFGLQAPTQVAVRQPQVPAESQTTPPAKPADFAAPGARTADAAATGALETVDEPRAPVEPQVKPAEGPTDFAAPAARTADAAATGALETVDEPQVPVEPQVTPAEEPTDFAALAARAADAAAAGALGTVDEPRAPVEPQVKPAEEPTDFTLPAARTADAAQTRAVAATDEQQVPVVPSVETAANPADHSFPDAQTSDSIAAGTLMKTNETRTSLIEGSLPAAATTSDTAASELAPTEPRIVAGSQGREQVAVRTGQPLSEPAARLAGAAASAATIGSVTILSAASELAATLSSTGANASESTALANLDAAETAHGSNSATAIKPTNGFDVSSEDTAGASAATENDAPVVAAYEVPENALLPRGDGRPEPEDSVGVEGAKPDGANAAAEPVPASTLEVSLVHPEEAAVPADQSVEFPVKVFGSDEELTGHYLIISGLKRGARVSRGIELMFDTWRIDVTQLADLQLIVPAGFARRQHVDIELRRADGTTRDRGKIVIATPGAAAIIADDADDADDLPAEVRRTVDEGEVQIDNGSVQGARILFERAAGKGSARAALLLAGSYDSRVIAAYKTATPPSPDAAEARRWYERAIELGATRASQTLESLP